MLLKAAVIAAVIFAALAALMGKLYVGAREDLAATEQRLMAANQQTAAQIRINAELRAGIATEQATTKDLLQKMGELDVRYQQEIRRIERTRAASEKAILAAPERAGPVLTFRLRRGMRDVCRSGGGSEADCKTEPVRPGKAGAGAADRDRDDRDHPAGDNDVE